VEFKQGFDRGFYTDELQEDINKFLSPWAFDDFDDIAFEGRIHKSRILNFIEERNYVDFVTCMKMYLYGQDGKRISLDGSEDLDVAEVTTSAAILVSYGTHVIKEVSYDPVTGKCTCEGDEDASSGIGISTMAISINFQVGQSFVSPTDPTDENIIEL